MDDPIASSIAFAMEIDDTLMQTHQYTSRQDRRDNLVELFQDLNIQEHSRKTTNDVQQEMRKIANHPACTLSKGIQSNIKNILMQRLQGKHSIRPWWEPWQFGSQQLPLPDTVPASAHMGIDFLCAQCGAFVVAGLQIHQLKQGAVWSNCIPDYVKVTEEPKWNKFKRCSLYQVFCGQEGCSQHVGAAYYEKYFDSESNCMVADKVFPCIKFRHVIEKKSTDGTMNLLVLAGTKPDVENSIRLLETTLFYNKFVEPGVRPSLNRNTYKDHSGLKAKVMELDNKVRALGMSSIEDHQHERERLEREKERVQASKEAAIHAELEARQERNALKQEREVLAREKEEAKMKHAQKMEEFILKLQSAEEEAKRKYDGEIESEKARLVLEEEKLRAQLAKIEQERMQLQEKAAENPQEDLKRHLKMLRKCPCYCAAERSLESLKLDPRLFNRQHDRCYCSRCYDQDWPDTIEKDGPKPYVIPRGWVRFGLAMPPQAQVLGVFDKWCVSFHGTKHYVAKSIIETGDLLMPGDTLPDGSKLESSNCAGRTDRVNYTSPTINYAGLAFYARPSSCPSPPQMFQVVLQCRQKPDTFRVQAETMNFRKAWKTGERDLCPHVNISEVEWVTQARKSVIPYGILVRTFKPETPPDKFFKSPVDPKQFW